MYIHENCKLGRLWCVGWVLGLDASWLGPFFPSTISTHSIRKGAQDGLPVILTQCRVGREFGSGRRRPF